MSSTTRFQLQLAIVALPVVGLAAVGWRVSPERQAAWTTVAVAMALVWLLNAVLLRGQKNDDQRRNLVGNALFGAAMLALALAVKLAQSFGYVPGDEGNRIAGVGVGLLMAALGNNMAKSVASLTAGRCTPAVLQAIYRFNGWVMAIGGLVFALAWVVLPVDRATIASLLIAATTIVLNLGRIGWARRARHA